MRMHAEEGWLQHSAAYLAEADSCQSYFASDSESPLSYLDTGSTSLGSFQGSIPALVDVLEQMQVSMQTEEVVADHLAVGISSSSALTSAPPQPQRIVLQPTVFNKNVDVIGKLTARNGLLVPSDERVKTFLSEVSLSDCCKLLKLVLQNYEFKDLYREQHSLPPQVKAGFSAQDLESLLPQLVEHHPEPVPGDGINEVVLDFRRVKWDELLV